MRSLPWTPWYKLHCIIPSWNKDESQWKLGWAIVAVRIVSTILVQKSFSRQKLNRFKFIWKHKSSAQTRVRVANLNHSHLMWVCRFLRILKCWSCELYAQFQLITKCIFFRIINWGCHWFWGWCDPHLSSLWRVCPTPFNPEAGHSWTKHNKAFDQGMLASYPL